FTRREALQGIAGVAAAAMLPLNAEAKRKEAAAAWPADAQGLNRALPFNDGWRFHRGDAPGADAASFDDSAWRTLDVPHDWTIEDLATRADEGRGAEWTGGVTPLRTGPFDIYESEGQMATGWTVGGIGWYRKTFAKPELPPGGKAELRFEGVYMNSDVWLNGVLLGNHPYGYTEFAYDITPRLQDGENIIAVQVKNTGKNSRWYSGSGIFRKVWLNTYGELRIPAHGVYATMPEVAADAALVNIEVTVENGASAARQATVRARLLDASGAVAGEANAAVTVDANNSTAATCAIRLASPHLWSPADPHLYRGEVIVEADHKVVHATALNIGVRKVEIDAVNGLRINGESTKLRGGCVHHDNGPLGSACIPGAEERRVAILKANGYNAIRTSHNPPSPAFLDACDRLGVLVIDEAFDCWEAGSKNPDDYHLYFKDWWQRDLSSMIVRDRNHPSVILWSIGNEVNERATPEGVEIGKNLAALAHQLDPTRKVTAAIPPPFDHPKQTWADMQAAFTYLDVGGYNYQLGSYEKDHADHPDRIMVGTESFPNQSFQNWRAVESDSWVIGDFIWTAIDYLGESGIGHASIHNGPGPDSFNGPYPWFNSYCGDIDLIGNKKPQSYFRDVVWRRSKVEMAVRRPIPAGYTERVSMWGWSDELRSWTWGEGFDGAPMTVRVYTRGDKATLFLNGKQVGSKDLTEKDALRAEFTVAYAAGELKAVAYRQGSEIGSITFATAGKPHQLVLTPDRAKLRASRDDLSYVMVRVADEDGHVIPDAVVPVSFSLAGAGELAAVGNGNPKDVASFRLPHRRTYQGACVAIVRPTGGSGNVELRAESPGLEAASVQIDVAG
ncbi:MAG: sugar-binding domain-containing protein, partial [Terracidiphilus sp.]